MLNFIVLGYVPGTTIQITYTNFMIAMLVALVISLAAGYIVSYLAKQKTKQIAAIRLVSLH